MLELKFVASIAERDVDLLVLEEFSVSEEFREWFSSRVFGEPMYQAEIGAWHSVSDAQLGESDIVFIFEAISGPRTAILIENKIGAPPQPKQGERYRIRGEKGQKEGYWERFKTCIIAPRKYLRSNKQSEIYDTEVSYEELLAYFQSRTPRDCRYSYKAKIILEGIEQNRRGYEPEYSHEMTDFVSKYFEICADQSPELCMQEAKPRPAGSTWIMFNPKILTKEISLTHQLTAGFVKILFNGKAEEFERLKEEYTSKLPPGALISLAGKSVAISIEVPKLDPIATPFSDQEEKVRQALRQLTALERLLAETGGKTP